VSYGKDFPGFSQRKGSFFLTRLNVSIPFESTIEERFLQIVDMDLRIVAARRSDSVQVFAPDGTTHTYTADYDITLSNGQSFVIECKPRTLLLELLRDDFAKWQARTILLEQGGRSFQVVTEDDLPNWVVQWAMSFAPFYNVPVSAEISKLVLQYLKERGPTPLSVLKKHIEIVAKKETTEIFSEIYGMIARQEIVADSKTLPPYCLLGLPNSGIEIPELPIGKPIRVVLADLPALKAGQPKPSPVITTNQHLERRYLESARGPKMLRLFSLYSDPQESLAKGLAGRLATEVSVSSRTIYRFQEALFEAGAPGIVFTDLVPYLMTTTPRKPRRQVDAAVATVIEVLAAKAWYVLVGTEARARSIGDLHGMVRVECLNQELSPPSYTTVKRFVNKINLRDPIRAAQRRYGRDSADAIQDRQGYLTVLRHGEILGIDCSPCDIFMTKDGVTLARRVSGRGKAQRRKDARRGNFVTVTDTATSEVLRSVIFDEPIGAELILEVLREVFLADTQVFTDAGVTTIPFGRGRPKQIRMDSGREFVNAAVTRAMEILGITVVPRDASSKHHGGIEERTIGILSHAHHVLTGTTMNSIENRRDYDAQLGAVMNLDDLNTFHQRVIERHNNLQAPLRMHTRREHAQELHSNGLTSWRPLSDNQDSYVRDRMHPQELRKCLSEGISLHGLKYNSPELRPFIVQQARLEVTYNSDDISIAWAVNPDTSQLIELKARLPAGLEGPITLKEWRSYKRRVIAARQGARDGEKTLQQIAGGVMDERRIRLATERAASRKKSRTTKSQVRLVDEYDRDDNTQTIEAAPIVFLENPIRR
jgi:Mu transposase, C-terminal